MKITTLLNPALLPGTPVVCLRDLGEYRIKRKEHGIIESVRVTIDIDENLLSKQRTEYWVRFGDGFHDWFKEHQFLTADADNTQTENQ